MGKGNMGHSRKNLDSIIYCVEKVKTEEWLLVPLLLTRLPPHYWTTVGKGAPSRITNQDVLIVAQDQNGILPQYRQLRLAKQSIGAIENNFSSDILSRLCGFAADGRYQASAFRNLLHEILLVSKIHKDLGLPITWDPACLLNLGVTDVMDSKSESAEFFRVLIKHCNVLNQISSHGKGFSFLQVLEEP